MAFVTIGSTEIAVSKALKAELFQKIKDNFDDHETRLNDLSVGSGPVVLINEEIENVSSTLTLTGLKYIRAFNNMNITKAQIQIFTKGGVTSGTLEVDLKKSATLGGTYTSIFTTKPYINFATDTDYTSRDGVLNTGQAVTQDEILRLDITNVPASVVIAKFRLMVYGVLS